MRRIVVTFSRLFEVFGIREMNSCGKVSIYFSLCFGLSI